MEDTTHPTFKKGDLVKSRHGTLYGTIVGTYSTDKTPEGYCIQIMYEENKVVNRAVDALRLWDGKSLNTLLKKLELFTKLIPRTKTSFNNFDSLTRSFMTDVVKESICQMIISLNPIKEILDWPLLF